MATLALGSTTTWPSQEGTWLTCPSRQRIPVLLATTPEVIGDVEYARKFGLSLVSREFNLAKNGTTIPRSSISAEESRLVEGDFGKLTSEQVEIVRNYTVNGSTGDNTLFYFDYAGVLRTLIHRYQYALVLEDDTAASASWPMRVEQAIEAANAKFGKVGWSYVYLYRSNMMEPGLERYSVPALMAIIIIALAAGHVVAFLVSCQFDSFPPVGGSRRSGGLDVSPDAASTAEFGQSLHEPMKPRCRTRRSYYGLDFEIAAVSVAGAIVFTCFVLGREHTVGYQTEGLVQTTKDCCTQAVLYNSRVADLIATEFESTVPRYSLYDIHLYRTAKREMLKRAIWAPSVFQHTGFVSLRGGVGSIAKFATVQQSTTFPGIARPLAFDYFSNCSALS